MTPARWHAGALIVLVMGCYLNTLKGGFHYDDFHSIVHNPYIRDWSNGLRFFMDPSVFSGDPDKAMYRPILLLSYAFNYSLGAYQPWGYLLTNVLIHLGVSLLVWRLALHVGLNTTGAWVAGIIFALHPVASEPVNYISARSESLAALFYLAAFLLVGNETRVARWGGVLCYSLGLLTKSIVITLPLVFLLYEYYQGLKFTKRWPRHCVLWFISVLYLSIFSYMRFFSSKTIHKAPRGILEQFAVQLKAGIYYIKLLWFPINQNVEHQFFSGSAGIVVGTAVLLFISLALALRGGRRWSGLFWLWWSVLTLAPASLVPLNVLVNEHRLYLPLVGGAIWIGILWEHRSYRLKPYWIIWGILLTVFSIQRQNIWSNELSLWQDAAVKSPLMPRVHVNLGMALQTAGQRPQALRAFAQAVALDSNHQAAQNNLGNIAYELALEEPDITRRQAHLAKAQAAYLKVLSIDANHKEALNNLGSLYLVQGQNIQALALYDQLIQDYPNFADGHYNRGQAAMRLNRLAIAQESFSASVELLPQVDGFVALGQVLVKANQLEAAVNAFEQAARMEPERPEHHYNVAAILLSMGEHQWQADQPAVAQRLWWQAHERLVKTLQLDSQHVRALRHLAELKRRLQ